MFDEDLDRCVCVCVCVLALVSACCTSASRLGITPRLALVQTSRTHPEARARS